MDVRTTVPRPLRPDEDEAHEISIGADEVVIIAATDLGATRAVASLLQLASRGHLPLGRLRDAPRHPWRGLLLDVCRHWMPVERVLETVDAMALAKLNVLHLHLSDDHAFRLELERLPHLPELGSSGNWYSRSDVDRIVQHADRYGIRVVPEVDVPGHTTSWLVADPSLAATPGPFELRRTVGIATVALDPTSRRVREVVADVLAEVAEQFPDGHLHVGGDEVAAEAWPGLDAHDAQREFTDWVVGVVGTLGRTAVVWDDAWHPELPDGVVTQVWRGHRRHRAVTATGPALWSSPYYLDLGYDARHLQLDPLADAATAAAARAALLEDPALGTWAPLVAHTDAEWDALTPDSVPDQVAADRVLGGEACHWTELATAESLHLRTWPTAAAVADVLWAGPAPGGWDVHDALDGFAAALAATTAVDPDRDRRDRWASIAAGDDRLASAVATLARCCEPQKWYARHALLPDERIDLPFDPFVDALPPTAAGVLDLRRGRPPAPLVAAWRDAAEVVLEWPYPDGGDTDPLATVRAVAKVVLDCCDGDLPATPPQVGEVVVTVGHALRAAGWST